MRLSVIGCTHGYLPEIPKCDIFIHCGDLFPPIGDEKTQVVKQLKWFNTEFLIWLEQIDAKYKIIVPGNHDILFEKSFQLIRELPNCFYLINNTIDVLGYKIFGTPYQPYFKGLAFNAPLDAQEDFLERKFLAVKQDTDIIISHCPPYGILDATPDGVKLGMWALRQKIDEIMPSYVFCAHAHHSRGLYSFARRTIIANVCYLSEKMAPQGECFTFNLTDRKF